MHTRSPVAVDAQLLRELVRRQVVRHVVSSFEHQKSPPAQVRGRADRRSVAGRGSTGPPPGSLMMDPGYPAGRRPQTLNRRSYCCTGFTTSRYPHSRPNAPRAGPRAPGPRTARSHGDPRRRGGSRARAPSLRSAPRARRSAARRTPRAPRGSGRSPPPPVETASRDPTGPPGARAGALDGGSIRAVSSSSGTGSAKPSPTLRMGHRRSRRSVPRAAQSCRPRGARRARGGTPPATCRLRTASPADHGAARRPRAARCARTARGGRGSAALRSTARSSSSRLDTPHATFVTWAAPTTCKPGGANSGHSRPRAARSRSGRSRP